MKQAILIFSLAVLLCSNIIHAQNFFPSSGNVGIGITDPAHKLHVLGDIYGTASTGNDITLGLNALTHGQALIQFSESGANNMRILYQGGTNQFLSFGRNGASDFLISNSSGYVGIGTFSPQYKLDVDAIVRIQNGQISFPTISRTIVGNGAGNAKINDPFDSEDTFIGYKAGTNVPAGVNTYHTFIGSVAGANATGGHGGVAIGQKAFVNTTTIQSSIALGGKAGSVLPNAQDDTFLGYAAAQFSSNTNLGRRVYIGRDAGEFDNGDYDIMIGWSAGPQIGNPTTGEANIGIGSESLYHLNNGQFNIAIGHQAGYQLTSSNGSVLIGYQAGSNLTSGRNIFLGRQAGYFTTGSSNIFMGESAGVSAPAAIENTFIAGSGASGGTARIDNVYFGKGYADASPTPYTINGTGGSGTNTPGADIGVAGGKGTGNASGGSIIFSTSSAGAGGSTLQNLSEKMRITAAGNVGIGTSDTKGFKLAVNGDAIFTRIKVKNHAQ